MLISYNRNCILGMRCTGIAAEKDAGGGASSSEQENMSQTLKALSDEAARLQSQNNATQSSEDLFNEPMFAG